MGIKKKLSLMFIDGQPNFIDNDYICLGTKDCLKELCYKHCYHNKKCIYLYWERFLETVTVEELPQYLVHDNMIVVDLALKTYNRKKWAYE